MDEKNQNLVPPQRRQEEKNIAEERLSRLKSGSSTGGSILGSKMFLRTKSQASGLEGIKIPTSSSLHGQALTYEKEKTDAAIKTLQEKNKGSSNQPATQSSSIFADKPDISRSELRQKLREGAGVFQAEEQVGLNMSPVQRVKLEKEVFSSALGENISKADLKSGFKKT